MEAVDTTGAGDAFIGSFAAFLAGGCGETEAISRANVYAALSTLAPGTQMSFATRGAIRRGVGGRAGRSVAETDIGRRVNRPSLGSARNSSGAIDNRPQVWQPAPHY